MPNKQIVQIVKSISSKAISRYAQQKLTEDPEQKRKEAKKQVAQRRAKVLADREVWGSDRKNTDPEQPRTTQSDGADLDRLIAQEDCEVCTSILEELQTKTGDERAIGIAEYGEFRHALEQSEEEAEAVLADSEVISDILRDITID